MTQFDVLRTPLNQQGKPFINLPNPIMHHKRVMKLYYHIAKSLCEHLASTEQLTLRELVLFGVKISDCWISESTATNLIYELFSWQVVDFVDIKYHDCFTPRAKIVAKRYIKLHPHWEGNLRILLSID
jgi:hypothetical protein